LPVGRTGGILYPAVSAFTSLLLAVAGLAVSPFAPGLVTAERFHPYLSVAAGLQYNVPMRLVIRQADAPDIKLLARYETRPFAEVPYYDIRLGIERRGAGWELELVHHKLYLANLPSEVDTFEITHGYNFLTLNRMLEWLGVEFRGGAGIVLTHPQTTVRDRRFPERGGFFNSGFYVSGPAAQLGAGERFFFGHRFFVGVEGKATGAFARIPIAGGNADVPNLALHGLLSVGWRF
jgi:hypothetical protein